MLFLSCDAAFKVLFQTFFLCVDTGIRLFLSLITTGVSDDFGTIIVSLYLAVFCQQSQDALI